MKEAKIGFFKVKIYSFCNPSFTHILEDISAQMNLNLYSLSTENLDNKNENLYTLGSEAKILFLDLELLEKNQEVQIIIEDFLSTAGRLNSYIVPFSINLHPVEIIKKIEKERPRISQLQGNYLKNLKNASEFKDFAIRRIRNSRRFFMQQDRHNFLIYRLSKLIDEPFRLLFNFFGYFPGLIATFVLSFLQINQITQIFLVLFLAGSGFSLNQFFRKKDKQYSIDYLYPFKLYLLLNIGLGILAVYCWQNLIPLHISLEISLTSVIFYSIWEFYSKPTEKLELCKMICSKDLDYIHRNEYKNQESTNPLPQENEREVDHALRKLKNLTRYGFMFPSNPWNWRNVFISHRNNDLGIAVTKSIAESLKKRNLMLPFVDFLNIKEGEFRTAIAEALWRSGTFISVLTPDNPQKQEWVQRELNAAFYFYIQYGEPYIIIIEAGQSIKDMQLDKQLIQMVEHKKIPCISLESTKIEENHEILLNQQNVIEIIENSLFRDYHITIMGNDLNNLMYIGYLLMLIAFPISFIALSMFLLNIISINNLPILTFILVNVFAISAYQPLSTVFSRFTASRFAIDSINPPLLSSDTIVNYILLWITFILLVLMKTQDSNLHLCVISILIGTAINIYSNSFVPTIWQGRKQYYCPPFIDK